MKTIVNTIPNRDVIKAFANESSFKWVTKIQKTFNRKMDEGYKETMHRATNESDEDEWNVLLLHQ